MSERVNGLRRRRRKGLVALIAVIALMAFVVIGCGDDDTSTSASTSGGGGESTSAETADVSGKKIGVLSLCEACEGVHRMTTGMQQATEAAGWEMQLVDAQGAPDKIAAGMDTLVQAGVDGIVLNAVEPALVKQGLQAAIDAGIPVVTQNVGKTTEGTLGDVSTNEAENTKVLNEKMIELIGGGPGKIGAVRYMSLGGTAARYHQLEEDAKANDLEIVNPHDSVAPNFADDAAKYTTQLLGANPDVKAIWTASTGDPAAVGAAKAVSRANSDAIVVGYNGDMDALAQIRAGGPFKATMAFPVEQGSYIATDLLLQHFAGKTPENKVTYLPAAVVTEENLPEEGEYYNEWGDYGAEFAEKWKEEYGL